MLGGNSLSSDTEFARCGWQQQPSSCGSCCVRETLFVRAIFSTTLLLQPPFFDLDLNLRHVSHHLVTTSNRVTWCSWIEHPTHLQSIRARFYNIAQKARLCVSWIWKRASNWSFVLAESHEGVCCADTFTNSVTLSTTRPSNPLYSITICKLDPKVLMPGLNNAD